MIGGRSRLKNRVCLKVLDWKMSQRRQTESQPTHQHLPDHGSRCQPDDEPDKHPGEYRYQSFVDHSDAFDLKVVGGPERKDEENTDEEERPGRVVFLFLCHWFVRWAWGSPDMDVCRSEWCAVHSSDGSTVTVSVGRLRRTSMTRETGACRSQALDGIFRFVTLCTAAIDGHCDHNHLIQTPSSKTSQQTPHASTGIAGRQPMTSGDAAADDQTLYFPGLLIPPSHRILSELRAHRIIPFDLPQRLPGFSIVPNFTHK